MFLNMHIIKHFCYYQYIAKETQFRRHYLSMYLYNKGEIVICGTNNS